ncbi:cullin family [Ceratobasidium sp. AG-Ba]|nr:cullin family [Ceratobasidium sp. AG-Ba]
MEQKPISELMLRASWNEAVKRINADKPGRAGLYQNGAAWTLVCDQIRPHDISKPKSPPLRPNEVIVRPLKLLESVSMVGPLLQWFTEEMAEKMPLVTSDIATYITRWDASQDVQELYHMFARLSVWYFEWSAPLSIFSNVNVDAPTLFRKNFRTNFLTSLPSGFPRAFHALLRSTLEAPALDTRLFPTLDLMGLLQDHESLVANVINEAIERRVREVADSADGETSVLQTVKDWFTESVVPWMAMTYGRGLTDQLLSRALAPTAGKFDYHICKVLCEIRTAEIFDIIVDYPDSKVALTDLKECMERADGRNNLVQTLRRLNKKRLLHPGADTKDILTQYVSTIRCLRILDPPGVLLFKVADPIRRYLRDRPDTIRCIVGSLVGDGSDLLEENEQVLPIQALNEPYEDYTDPAWEPDPNDAEPEFRTSKPGDIVSTLVSIYDSRDLFVKELQNMLGQRLLAVKDHNYDNETRNVEILKLRFGEAALQLCDVMLKDVTDSRRIDKHMAGKIDVPLHPTIISHLFWPSLQTTSLKMPGQFQKQVCFRMQEVFEHEYEEHKAGKKLRWMNNLGTISLDVELEDRTISADATPLEAAVIELFSEKATWNLSELAPKLGLAESALVRPATESWASRGVLKSLGNGEYQLLERSEDNGNAARRPVLDLEAPDAIATGPSEEEMALQAAQMEVYWNFTKGILTNLGALPIERIQAMLSLAPGYNKTVEQLTGFLESARNRGLVDFNDGLWRLVNRGAR